MNRLAICRISSDVRSGMDAEAGRLAMALPAVKTEAAVMAATMATADITIARRWRRPAISVMGRTFH